MILERKKLRTCFNVFFILKIKKKSYIKYKFFIQNLRTLCKFLKFIKYFYFLIIFIFCTKNYLKNK